LPAILEELLNGDRFGFHRAFSARPAAVASDASSSGRRSYGNESTRYGLPLTRWVLTMLPTAIAAATNARPMVRSVASPAISSATVFRVSMCAWVGSDDLHSKKTPSLDQPFKMPLYLLRQLPACHE
jgi:hypothetical protein